MDEVRRWLADPEWPQFGPGIGRGPLDPGRMAARAAAGQVLDVVADGLQPLVAEWRRMAGRTSGEEEADEGYAAGLGVAVFMLEERIAAMREPR